MQPSISDLQTIPCDIVLLPSDEQSQLAIQASQLLSSQGSLFTLDNLNYYAHASLYMFQMDINNQNDCISALQQIASNTRVQHLVQDGYVYQDSGFGKGYVDVAFARNEETDLIQEIVVDKFNSLRAGMRESDKNKMAGVLRPQTNLY